MGLFSESKSERARREHNEGQKDGSKATWADKFAHRVGGNTGFSDDYNAGWDHGVDHQPRERESRERHREDKPSSSRRRKKNNNSSGSSSSSSSSDSGSAGWLGCVGFLVVGGLALWGLNALSNAGWRRYEETKKWQNQQTVWTMREVSAINLNVRSGPGTDSPTIATLPRGHRLAVTGDPVKNGNELWIRVSTDDGKIQGWANQKYINLGPHPLGYQAGKENTEAEQRQPRTTAKESAGWLGLQIDVYCKNKYGNKAYQSWTTGDAFSWRCTVPADNQYASARVLEIDMDEVCRMQHGSNYKSVYENRRDDKSWHCVPK